MKQARYFFISLLPSSVSLIKCKNSNILLNTEFIFTWNLDPGMSHMAFILEKLYQCSFYISAKSMRHLLIGHSHTVPFNFYSETSIHFKYIEFYTEIQVFTLLNKVSQFHLIKIVSGGLRYS